MKVVILAGGLGTRLAEFTKTIPKPMVRIGRHPIIIHIINHYAKYQHKDFLIAAGYKSKIIKRYFKNYVTNGKSFQANIFKKKVNITIVDTGKNSLTGGRLKRMENYLKEEKNFMFTYGDGVSDVNLKRLKDFHIKNNKLITVTAVRPPARFGEIKIKKNRVISFKEKPQVTDGWINGGFFVAKKEFINLIKNDHVILEKKPLEKACKKNELVAFRHEGFWKCMDVKRDRDELQKIYMNNRFIWKKNTK